MKRLLKSKPLKAVGIALLAIILANWGIRLQCKKTYVALVSNNSVISAFRSGDDAAIDSVVKSNDLAYQRVQSGKITSTSRSWLPRLKVINYSQTVTEGVILPESSDSLKLQQPYRMIIGRSIYVMAPVCGVDCSNDIYLVYSRAIL